MKSPQQQQQQDGGTIIVVLTVVATILALLGSAVAYTQHVSRVSDRSRKAAQALEVGDGHLEYLFTHWRNISRAPGFRRTVKQPPTNFFYTTEFNPTVTPGLAPAPTPWAVNPSPSPWPGAPPLIPKPSPSLFANVPEYTVSQYRIQAVSPMIELDANENALLPNGSPMPTDSFPTAGDGPNTWQYSIYYLAAVDVTIPAMTGSVTAKVRRVFEKKYDNPWTNAMFFHDDLELHPSDPLVIDGPVQTNNNLYIGSSNFTALNRVAYGGEYINGWSPSDTSHTGSPTAPNFVADLPPSQESPYLPFGWNLKLDAQAGNNESYRELIERPVNVETDTLAEYRYYNQASYRVLIDQSNNISITKNDGTVIANSGSTKHTYDAIAGAITTNVAMYDVRQSNLKGVRVANVDVSKINAAIASGNMPGFNGVLYVSDTTPHGTSVSSPLGGGSGSNIDTTTRGVRLINAATLPSTGLTFVSENPVYVKGNFNTGGSPASNTGSFSSPTVSGYTRRNSAIIGDAITVLSNSWSDTNSNNGNSNSRPATSTTINAALVGGIVKSDATDYSGGGENFIRLLEDWKDSYFTYYGSMVQLYESKQATGRWRGSGQVFKSPKATRYFWDKNFGTGAPPGQLQFVAYLQQQRWYQVY